MEPGGCGAAPMILRCLAARSAENADGGMVDGIGRGGASRLTAITVQITIIASLMRSMLKDLTRACWCTSTHSTGSAAAICISTSRGTRFYLVDGLLIYGR